MHKTNCMQSIEQISMCKYLIAYVLNLIITGGLYFLQRYVSTPIMILCTTPNKDKAAT